MPDYSLADIAAATGGGNNNGNGFGDGNGAWWLLVLFALLGGFGNRGYGGGYGGGAGGVGGNELYPWLNNAENINGGFRDQMLGNQLTGIQNGITDVASQLCNGFSQAQLGTLQGFNALQAQLAQCCCDNRLATANLNATIMAENCADRAAMSDGVRDIIASQAAGTQRIIDQLCQDKIDAKNDEIAQLRQQVQMQNLAASQQAQTAQILADNFAQTNALEQYLAPVPRPAYVVQNPNCCQQTFGCGCTA